MSSAHAERRAGRAMHAPRARLHGTTAIVGLAVLALVLLAMLLPGARGG